MVFTFKFYLFFLFILFLLNTINAAPKFSSVEAFKCLQKNVFNNIQNSSKIIGSPSVCHSVSMLFHKYYSLLWRLFINSGIL